MDLDAVLAPFEERYERIKELSDENRKRLYLMIGDVEESVGIEHIVDCLADETSMAGDGVIRCYVGFEPSGKAHIGWKVLSLQLKRMLEADANVLIFLADWHAWVTTNLAVIWKISRRLLSTWKKHSVPSSIIQKKEMDLDNFALLGEPTHGFWGLLGKSSPML